MRPQPVSDHLPHSSTTYHSRYHVLDRTLCCKITRTAGLILTMDMSGLKSWSPETSLEVGSLFQTHKHPRQRAHSIVSRIILVVVSVAATAVVILVWSYRWSFTQKFPNSYASVRTPHRICDGVSGNAVSHSGFIGLQGDSEDSPRRSFFW